MGATTVVSEAVLVQGLPLSASQPSGGVFVLSWTPVPCLGYVLYRDAVRISNSWDPNKRSWRVNYKRGAVYKVVALSEVASGSVVG